MFCNLAIIRLRAAFLQGFTVHFAQFKESIKDLDLRLASIVCQGFEDCSGLESVFRVIVLVSY